MTTIGNFSFTTETGVCDGCGNVFVKSDYRQRVCRKNCGRHYQTKRVQFVGVDGEGVSNNGHKYVLFGVGDRHIENPDGLDWKECYSFLYREFKRRGKGHAFVGFFLGYDFTQILKTLPEGRARMLLTQEGKAMRKHRIKGKQPHPVLCDEWEFDILGYKRLRIRPHDCDCVIATCKCPKQSWCYLCDVGAYWQTSFLNVINPKNWGDNPICTKEEYDLVDEGKMRRSSAMLDDDMRKYMHLEIDILERAMSVLADGFEEIGIHLSPSQWYGPGQASSAWMKGRVPNRDEWLENQPEWYLKAARESYYGGWFETFCHGRIYRDVWEYDINSAYPAIIQNLPCLLHGKWTRGTGKPPGGKHCLVKARVQVPGFRNRKTKNNIGAMMHRDRKGNISRPAMTEGWYWLEELEASIEAKCVDSKTIQYQEWVNYEACDCPPPFEEIADLYLKRLEVGKDTPLGKGAKLVYNAEYGKFAQSIGEPQFGNPIYASRITSGCRTQILRAIASHPQGQTAVAMIATDAVFFLTPHPTLPVSDKLGEWGQELRKNLTIFKPGVYWDDKTRKMIRERKAPKFKARGINANQFAEQIGRVDFEFASWEDNGFTGWPTTTYESGFSMVTCLQALMRNDWSLAGTNDPKDQYQSSDPFRKRGKPYKDDAWGVWRTGIHYPEYDWEEEDWSGVVSYPYEKRFGIEDPFSDESREQNGISEDGTLNFVYSLLLRNDEE